MMELTDRLLLCSDETGTTLVLEKATEQQQRESAIAEQSTANV